MSIQITHPEEGFTGDFAGIQFTNGAAELPSLSDEAQDVLREHGLTFKKTRAKKADEIVSDSTEGDPVEIVGEKSDEK